MVRNALVKTKKPKAASLRQGGIENFFAQGTINSKQKRAADRFLSLYERAQADGLRAINYSNVRVDVRRSSNCAADQMINAKEQLNNIRQSVGSNCFFVLTLAAGQSLTVTQISAKLPANDNGQTPSPKTTKFRIIGALDRLVEFWDG